MQATSFDQRQWNRLVASSPYPSFLQSWQWGEMQRVLGTEFWRLAVGDGLISLVIKRPLPFGWSWLYIPGGPIAGGTQPSDTLLRAWYNEIVHVAHAQGAIFMRCDPRVSQEQWRTALQESGWRKAEREIQPRNSLVMDLKLAEEELLSGMHAKTRYNIRLAQRKEVRIRFSREARDLDLFDQLAHEVNARSSFRYHPSSYYRAMLDTLTDDCALEIGVAEREGKVLAVHLFVTFAGTTTYLHGASSTQARHFMAPHLLHWEAIRRAKEQGSHLFDFYGVAPAGAFDHPWAGITRYKEGFGGRRTTTIGAYDYIVSRPKSWLYTAVHQWRRR